MPTKEVVIGIENIDEIKLWINEVARKIEELDTLIEARPRPRASAATVKRSN